MQKTIFLILLSFSLVSCYTYQVKKQMDAPIDNKQAARKREASLDLAPAEAKTAMAEPQSQTAVPTSVNIQEQLAPNKNVKIDVNGRSYKVIVDRWETDSLVAHPVHNPKQILKFHKNQIDTDKIAEKRFSKPIADIITIAAYTGIGVTIWYLLQ